MVETTVRWEELFDDVAEFIANAKRPVTVIAPFIDPDVLRKLVDRGHIGLVVTSWRPDHLVTGVSRLETYDVVRSIGAKLAILDRLHAKVITADMSTALIGSANLTEPGLGLCAESNFELLAHIDSPDAALKAFICRVLIDAQFVDDGLYEQYRLWLEELPRPNTPLVVRPLFRTADAFLLSQLPATESPYRLWAEVKNGMSLSDEAIHDMQLLKPDLFQDERGFVATLRAGWLANAFCSRVLEAIDSSADGVYFGEMKEFVQRNCADVPMPYRSELTSLVQNLFRWIAETFPGRYEVSRPRFSERIRNISQGAFE